MVGYDQEFFFNLRSIESADEISDWMKFGGEFCLICGSFTEFWPFLAGIVASKYIWVRTMNELFFGFAKINFCICFSDWFVEFYFRRV